MTEFLERHNGQIARYEERSSAYAVLVAQIVSTFNGGLVVALLAFIAARKETVFLWAGVAAVVVCGIAFLLVITSLAAGFFFTTAAHRVLAEADVSDDGDDYADRPDVDGKLDATKPMRLLGIRLMLAAIAFTLIGSVLCGVYLIGALL